MEDEAGDPSIDGTPKPTRCMFVALRHTLVQITAKVVEHFQDLAGGRYYDTVINLNKELVAFWDTLPAAYRLDGGRTEKPTDPSERGRAWEPNGRNHEGD